MKPPTNGDSKHHTLSWDFCDIPRLSLKLKGSRILQDPPSPTGPPKYVDVLANDITCRVRDSTGPFEVINISCTVPVN